LYYFLFLQPVFPLTLIPRRLAEELARLEKNRERRHQREKAKGIFPTTTVSPSANSPAPTADGETPVASTPRQAQATQRKCANCGQVGHIKTNKKCVSCGHSLLSHSKRKRQDAVTGVWPSPRQWNFQTFSSFI
jgi:ribosomal protein L37E